MPLKLVIHKSGTLITSAEGFLTVFFVIQEDLCVIDVSSILADIYIYIYIHQNNHYIYKLLNFLIEK